MKINKFEGENVMTVVSYLRGAIACLQNVQKLPHDIVSQVCDILQTSSVEEFNKYFESAKIAIDLDWERLGRGFAHQSAVQVSRALQQRSLDERRW